MKRRPETCRKAILVHRLDGSYRSDLLATVLVLLDRASKVKTAHGVSDLQSACTQRSDASCSALVLGWGASCIGMGFSKTYGTLCATRFLLGLFEG
jgi:hypothetical protein